MGNRLSKIYTRTGDDGTTGMADGSRLSKADLLFWVMGDVDELNSQLGLVRSILNSQADKPHTYHQANNTSPLDIEEMLTTIQRLLFNLGGELAMPSYEGIKQAHIDWLENQIDGLNAYLPALKDFILPTGSLLVSHLQVARAICRRAERRSVQLLQANQPNTPIKQTAITFLNRLSDWLFVAARFCTNPAEVQETLWNAEVLSQF